MPTPLGPDALIQALRAEGVRVVEHRSWRTHNRNHVGVWGPVEGVMIHHTVTSGTASSVELCYNGHSSLPGPLCHGVIAKDGTVYMVGNGRANHAGLGDDEVLAAVKNSTPLPADNEANTDGNRYFYGFECVNLGDGKDTWPEAQLDAIERVSAALCRRHGWTERKVIGHLEWQPGKIDPRGFTMAAMRARIAARINEEADDMELTAENLKQIGHAVHAYKNTDVEPVDAFQLLRYAAKANNLLAVVQAVVAAQELQVAALQQLAEQVSRLQSGGAVDVTAFAATVADATVDELARRTAE